MYYPTANEIARINGTEIGPDLLADPGLLESAAMRPQQSVGGEDAYPDIHSKAAALFESLCLNHAFIDGNKRTAILALGWFYARNGWWLMANQDDLVELALSVVKGELRGVELVAHRLQKLTRELPTIDE